MSLPIEPIEAGYCISTVFAIGSATILETSKRFSIYTMA